MEKLTMGQTRHRTRRRGARGVRATAAATSAASQRSRKSGAGALHLLIRPATPGWLLGEGHHLVWNRRKQVIREREKENTFRSTAASYAQWAVLQSARISRPNGKQTLLCFITNC